MKKLKVVQVNKLYAPYVGGIERVVREVAESLNDKEDIDMQVLVCRSSGKTEKERYNGVKLIRAGSMGTYFSMPVSFKFFSYLKRLSETADVMCFHMPFPLGDLGCLLSGYKGKVILWWHSDVIRQKAIMPIYRPIMHKFLKRADCIIVATQGHINCSENLKPYEYKCRIIPYGIDEEEFKNGEVKTKILEKNTVSGGVKVLFVGRLVYYKGIEVLINAFAKTNGAELFIVGQGPLEEMLKEKIKENNIENRVHFLGKLDDNNLKACLRDCDILAFPSIANSEGFGLVQLEAMVYKKPVINTSLPTGVPLVSLDGVSGITAQVNDVDSFAEALQKLTDDDKLRKKYGENGYKRVKEVFERKDMTERFYEVIKELTGE